MLSNDDKQKDKYNIVELTTEQVLLWFPWLTKEQAEDFAKGKVYATNNEPK